MPEIREIQSILKKFIMDLDVKEAYEFSIHNQFLINEEELQNLINELNAEEQEFNTNQNDMLLDLNQMVNSSDDSLSSGEEDNNSSQQFASKSQQ
jgi:hypothetical protein